jgi:hypothetical protein
METQPSYRIRELSRPILERGKSGDKIPYARRSFSWEMSARQILLRAISTRGSNKDKRLF